MGICYWTQAHCIAGGELRAAFWRSQGWANLERATVARWTFQRRHWPEVYLHEFMIDLGRRLIISTNRGNDTAGSRSYSATCRNDTIATRQRSVAPLSEEKGIFLFFLGKEPRGYM